MIYLFLLTNWVPGQLWFFSLCFLNVRWGSWIKIPYQMLVCIDCIVSRLVLAEGERCSAFLSFWEWVCSFALHSTEADTPQYRLCHKTFICIRRRMGLGAGCLADGIIRYFKNRNTWPCLLLFLVSLETVLTCSPAESFFGKHD